MSGFAKAFIVVNLLLTGLLTFLMGTLLAQKADYKAEYLTAFRDEDVARTNLDRRSKDYDARTHYQSSQLVHKRTRWAGLDGTHAETKRVLAQQQADLSKLRSEVSTLDSRWTALQARYKNMVERKDELEKQTKAAREERDKAVAQRRTLKAGRSQIDAEILKLQEKVNDLTKLVIERGASTQELLLLVDMVKERYPDLDIAEQIALIDGKVKSIAGDLVTLTVGRDDGVELGYPFTVVRGTTYIGRVVVRKVNKETSVARIDKDMLARGRRIQAGDAATTRVK